MREARWIRAGCTTAGLWAWVSIAGATTYNYGTGDSISLDQPRVVAAFQHVASGDWAPPSATGGSGFTMILDTGASGYLLATGAQLDPSTADPVVYHLAGTYLEQGVGGFESVGLSEAYDVTLAKFDGAFGAAASGSVSQYVVPDQHLLIAPDLELGSFNGIIGMPGMVGQVVLANLAGMTPLDLLPVGFDSALPAAPGTGNVHTLNLGKISFDPTTGQVNPTDPLPSYADLPTIAVGTGQGAATSSGTYLFDTGAQLTMISAETAAALDINFDPDAVDTDVIDLLPVGGVGGSAEIPVVQIDTLSLTTGNGDVLEFNDIQVGVLDVPGLPVDGILGFNLFTTGYLAALFSPGDLDGAFVELALDFTGETWQLRLTENPDFDPGLAIAFDDEFYYALNEQALFAWPPFVVAPEPASAALLVSAAVTLLTRRRGVSSASRG